MDILEAVENLLRDHNKACSLTNEEIRQRLEKSWEWHGIDREVSLTDIIKARETIENCLMKGCSFSNALHAATFGKVD